MWEKKCTLDFFVPANHYLIMFLLLWTLGYDSGRSVTWVQDTRQSPQVGVKRRPQRNAGHGITQWVNSGGPGPARTFAPVHSKWQI